MTVTNNLELVNVDCPLCGESRDRFERSLKGFRLVRCTGCNLIFVNPQPSSKALTQIYEEKKDPGALIDLYARLATSSVLAEYDRKLDQLEEMLGRKGRILDFACAAAYFVERASARGWDAHGSDIGPWARQAAAIRGVRNIHIGNLPDLAFPDRYFDVVYAAQVLEHLQNPREILAEVHRILQIGGILYVDVPNYQTIPIVLKRDDFYLNTPPQHINFFTPATLKRLLTDAHYDVTFVTTEGGLKWENLIGRPIISDIADAYATHDTHNRESRLSERGLAATQLKRIFNPPVRYFLYRWMKVGINLLALARRPLPVG